MGTKGFKNFILLSLLAGFSFLMSCSEDNLEEPQNDNEYVNNWIYANMSNYYLWNFGLPSSPDFEEEPSAFFESLKVSQDRFSRLFPDYEALINSLGGDNIEAGYEFTLVKVEDNIIVLVTYIKEGSPADDAGLMRGDRVYKVNGKSMTVDNYSEIYPEVYDAHSIEYKRFDELTGEYIDMESLNLPIAEVAENPHFIYNVYNEGDKRIGYYMYNFFSGNNTENKYDDQMDEIIQSFKSENITDLILDFRYNGGGYISSARNLASLVGTNISSNDILYEYEFNDNLSEGNPDGVFETFANKAENLGALINGQIYILTSGASASASELVINSLNPFMNVTLVGETTVGKNVGSIPIEDEQNEENKYGLLPIAFYISNSQGFNDYSAGFTPEVQNIVNERTTPMYPLGDTREALLAHTIALITGADIPAKKISSEGPKAIGYSNENQIRFGNSILEAKK